MNEKTKYQQYREERLAELYRMQKNWTSEDRRELLRLATHPETPSKFETGFKNSGTETTSKDKDRKDQ